MKQKYKIKVFRNVHQINQIKSYKHKHKLADKKKIEA